MTTDWKKYLLKSGLPFEYEVKECFAKYKCIIWDEYTYIKPDENNIEKEFSYDLDANYLTKSGDMLNFMIECKYKTEPTAWFFLPDPYNDQQEVNPNSFLHPVDYFTDNKFLFNNYPYYNVQKPLGEFCLKGVEIFNDKFLELNIHKAIQQLSYAFIEKVIESMDLQLTIEHSTSANTISFNIPVIITNAELRLINKNLTIDDINNSTDINSISQEYDFLFFDNHIGENLRQHNLRLLDNYFSEEKAELFNLKNKSFATNLPHFINVLAQHYCPEAILIMHHDTEHNNYKKLFNYINYFFKRSQSLINRLKKLNIETEIQRQKIQRKFGVTPKK